MDQMWPSSSGTFTLIEFIPYSLWVALGRSYTHCYQLVFTPYFSETGDGLKWARWSPACVSVFSSECLIELMKRKCGNISLFKRGRLMTFSNVFFLPQRGALMEIWGISYWIKKKEIFNQLSNLLVLRLTIRFYCSRTANPNPYRN